MPKRSPAPPQPPAPTDAELRILGALWRLGPSTVREVNQALASEKRAGYTTTLKFLQIMHDKRLVTRDESSRSHLYAPAVTQADTQRQTMKDLLGRVFGGSAAAVVQHALSVQPASREELRRIRALLRRAEREQGGEDD